VRPARPFAAVVVLSTLALFGCRDDVPTQSTLDDYVAAWDCACACTATAPDDRVDTTDDTFRLCIDAEQDEADAQAEVAATDRLLDNGYREATCDCVCDDTDDRCDLDPDDGGAGDWPPRAETGHSRGA
jgi:hypothetical protein